MLDRAVRGQRVSEDCLAEAEARLAQAKTAAAALAEERSATLAALAASVAAGAAGARDASEEEQKLRRAEGEREAEGVSQKVAAVEVVVERVAGALALVGPRV